MKKHLTPELRKKLSHIASHERLTNTLCRETKIFFVDKSKFTGRLQKHISGLELRLRQNPGDTNAIEEYIKCLDFIDTQNSPAPGFVQACSRLLQLDVNSPLALHYLGKVFMKEELFKQSYLFFDKCIKLETVSDEAHVEFHFNLVDLIHEIYNNSPNSKISHSGFPINKLKFKFSRERGFYLPYFDFYTDEKGYGDKGLALANIHYALGKTFEVKGRPHNAKNCPYLKYFSSEV